MKNIKQILLAGSSHTSLAYLYVKRALEGKAIVSKLPDFAGNTEEILISLPGWPLEDKDIVHIYAGHRDLMFDGMQRPIISPERFKGNLEKILNTVTLRTPAKIVFSNIPPVAESLLEIDPERNQRIYFYNQIIEEVADKVTISLHDFCGFALSYNSGSEKYSDGLHFTRNFYKAFAGDLADFLISL